MCLTLPCHEIFSSAPTDTAPGKCRQKMITRSIASAVSKALLERTVLIGQLDIPQSGYSRLPTGIGDVYNPRWLRSALGGRSLSPAGLQFACLGPRHSRCSRSFSRKTPGHRICIGGVSASAAAPRPHAGCDSNGLGLAVSPSLTSGGNMQCGQSGLDRTLATQRR